MLIHPLKLRTSCKFPEVNFGLHVSHKDFYFTAHAIISGQHIMTFDHRFYDFLGECRYLLARDFVNGDFAIVVNYAKSRNKITKTVEVTVGSTTYIIDNGAVKTSANKEVNLPYVTPQVTILRKNNHVILTTPKGVKIDCDDEDDCLIEVPIHYFGKTAGLLGNYNHEQFDDMITSDKVKTSEVDTFASSWNVGRRCRVVNHAIISLNIEDPSSICHKYFSSDSSPLRPCFKMVNPAAYKTMCMNDVGRIVRAGEKDICGVIKMYKHKCEDASVQVELPSECGMCISFSSAFFKNSSLSKKN